MPTTATHTEHFDLAIRGLAGKTIKRVRHMIEEEIKGMSWWTQPANTIVIEFTDNTYAIVSSDQEGNDAGHLIVEGYDS